MKKLLLAVAAAGLSLVAHAQASRAISGAIAGGALGNIVGRAAVGKPMTLEQLAKAIAEQHNSNPARLQDGVVASSARADGRYVFIKTTLRLKPNLTQEERARFRTGLLTELPREFCAPLKPALDAGVIYMVGYYSAYGQHAATVRLGSEQCP